MCLYEAIKQNPTALRTLKTEPGRSRYLYEDSNRPASSLRARLRLNRANTLVQTEQTSVMTTAVGRQLCIRCSLAQQQPIMESVSHILLDCEHYRMRRTRLLNTLRQLIRPFADPRTVSSFSLSLPSILDGPPSIVFQAPCSKQQRSERWKKWLDITNWYLLSLDSIRAMAQALLPAL